MPRYYLPFSVSFSHKYMQYEKFIDMISDSTLQQPLRNSHLSSFNVLSKNIHTYQKKAIRILLPFLTTHKIFFIILQPKEHTEIDWMQKQIEESSCIPLIQVVKRLQKYEERYSFNYIYIYIQLQKVQLFFMKICQLY